MNTRIAKFEKVSFEQFKKDLLSLHNGPDSKLDSNFDWNKIKEYYDAIKLPVRGTAGSAGYDFFAPFDFTVKYDDSFIVPTGIKCKIENGWFLDINPRSGLGFKSGMRLANTRGIIDSDYYNNSSNEGHIMIKIVNESKLSDDDLTLPASKAFAQGIFTIYGLTEDDAVATERTGGIGSTSKN